MDKKIHETENTDVTEVGVVDVTEDDREEIFIPRGQANEDPNYYVGLNGKNYVLPRGKTSSVPKAVAAEIKLCRRAEDYQDENKEVLLKAAPKETK